MPSIHYLCSTEVPPTQFRDNSARGRAHHVQSLQITISMATSTSFFGQRRGSTRSHTYQVYRGKQVTKDRVTKVTNPQSNKQMKQRIRLTAVASFAAYLKQLLDHSFQGVAYGQPSLSEFRRINLSNAYDLDQVSFPPKDTNDPGVADFQISKGSLLGVIYPASSATSLACNNRGVEVKGANGIGGDIPATAENAKAIADRLGVEVGDQVTIIMQVTSPDFEKYYGDGSKSYFPSQFIVSRLITDINDSEFMKGWKIDVASEVITNGLMCIQLTDSGTIYPFGSDSAEYPAATGIESKMPSSWDLTGLIILASGVIVSRKVNGVYQRSQAFMNPSSIREAKALFTSYEDAEKTYLKDSSKSDKYLNGGTEVILQAL